MNTSPTARVPDQAHGIELLNDARHNRGTAFTDEERTRFGLHGLLPQGVDTIEVQMERAMAHYEAKTTDLERHIYLIALQDRNETLFYRFLVENLERLMPIVYTPTVGLACQQFGRIFRRSRGLYVSAGDRGRVRSVLDNWPAHDVRVIVVTDGERILGLGDLGANGMGIPVGKLCLYSACAGVPPAGTLPVTLDVGTNNEELLTDPLYLGVRSRRLRGEAYDALIEEFVVSANEKWPGVLVQFEDFANLNSFRLLAAYRDRVCTFNDDIQGTAAVTLAGLYSALRTTGGRLRDQRLLFLGAGGAGVGIADLIVSAMTSEGLDEEAARQRCWFVDSRGLVQRSRENLESHKLHYAHDLPPADDLSAAIQAMNPTALIGVSGRGGSFTEDVVQEMARRNVRPIIFALSNPTSAAECTAEDAYRWSEGRAIFASGSPFDPVRWNGTTLIPAQANNVYIFPGLGLGVIGAGAARVTDEMFAIAARTLADSLSEGERGEGRLFPPVGRIREISLEIAVAVAENAYATGLARAPKPDDLRAFLDGSRFVPRYEPQND
ncbi:MAG: NAD-dependent malic enzyme [Gemmatimonadota bacterium]|nr:MAG: NAD-dependent malic enzyme [Gemmatimonadota bacterium]